MPLVGSRFLETREGTIDLATGGAVMFRQLPPCPPPDERRWAAACARLLCVWHEDLPPLLDYGFTSEGRFEAYGCLPARRASADASAAVTAFLDDSWSPQSGFGPIRVGMRLVVPDAAIALDEVLEDGHPGHPIDIACIAEPGAGATTFLRLAASVGRRHGYVPVAASVLEQRPMVLGLIGERSVFLLSDACDSARQARRWLFALGTSSSRGHVLLRVVASPSRASDITLRLDPLAPDVLVQHVHVHPAIPERRVRAAAETSGGLPGRFVAALRHPEGQRSTHVLRVAEAHPAYTGEAPPAEPELEHPWRDLIADAVRLAEAGRRAAAERDLRQIAAAAERRHMAHAAAAAEVDLAHLLLARGRTTEARELFAKAAGRYAENHRLATRAAVGLGWVHVLHGDLESAESTFRVCRAERPSDAAVGLAWTLLLQGRDVEAERALGPARESPDGRDRARASAVAAALALAQQNLPAAARAATLAVKDGCDPVTACVAATLQVIVHGRVGDADSTARHAWTALASARSARVPLLALAARAALLEAQHACGRQAASRRALERLLRIAERVPPVLRARLWAVAARTHPLDHRRAECADRLASFVRATGARTLSLAATDPPGAALASDAAALVSISESSAMPMDTLKRVAEWLRERVIARAVSICDAAGVPLVRSGAQDAIAASSRVLQTRIAQPPWATTHGLESAVVIRYANTVQGALACRWPLSRTVSPEVVPIMTAAASVVAPAIALLSERAAAPPAEMLDGMVGRSRAMLRLREQIARAGVAPFPVLVEGESGAGKELVARAIHRESSRRLRAFVAINCAALSDDLFEAEVFGHARGAFTGAHAERAGLFEQADGGTLFLDEVSELSARAQAKLLRALQEGEVRRIGENHSRRVDVRVIAASNRRLEEEVAAGRFRRDLLFRLAVIRMAVPPLRERREDIPLLAAHCWDSAARRAGARSVLTPAAISRLSLHDWPGNVRELQNIIAALAVQVPRGRVSAEHVAALIGAPAVLEEKAAEERRLEEARRAFEREFIAAAIARCGGRHVAAARQLGISRQGLAKLMRRLEMR